MIQKKNIAEGFAGDHFLSFPDTQFSASGSSFAKQVHEQLHVWFILETAWKEIMPVTGG